MLGFFKSKLKKISKSLSTIKFTLGDKIRRILSGKVDESAYEHLEQLFFEADLGAELSMDLVERVRRKIQKNKEISSEEILKDIKEELLTYFPENKKNLEVDKKPYVVMIVGVNGSGKTTSIAKLASKLKKEGKKVLLVAGDTFRAAAIEQLGKWAEKIGIDCIKSKTGSDPAAVVHDSLTAAKARDVDVVLIDTAGRLHTKTDLMHELEKIKRVSSKLIDNAPHETLLVLDATTGQNALDQAKTFHQFTPISSIILTKLDGSAKGGIVVAIQKQLQIPVSWVGLGESEEDFIPFDAKEFLDALLSTNN
ncbi:MAG: signal recognition particle-docking protein FtsY [Chlamydiae bacterium CG10_big_fil_rev_8_21_14_0_10_35_9]|nr:MAG: signal recognition particle-docking protein FtsY [Chlamydiae bacterium CG10_big_fil_rev_8_21_14_0_10_35_9]